MIAPGISQQRDSYVPVRQGAVAHRKAILAPAQNSLIEQLPSTDRLRLLAICERVDLGLAEVLCDPGDVTRYVYFPIDGFISMVAVIEGSPGVEVGLVGREGMLGAQLLLGVEQSPLHAVVQGQGAAWRIAARAFRGELSRSAALKRQLHRYLYVLMVQQSTSAACIRFHLTGPRLARWLLMSHDRAQSDRFHVTQEFLAYMLGMRRVGITAAAGALQKEGLIAYARGEVTVLNRRGLEATACGCYAAGQLAYSQFLG